MIPRVSVGALLAALGSGALTALATPQGLAQTVGPPVIDDRAGQRPAPDATVLLLGVSGVADVERAALAGAAAVVIRAPGDAGAPLIRAAERFGVSLLVAGAAVPWGELYAMIRTLFTVYEPSEPGEGDLFALADRVARETGGAVAIEDMSMRVVAYSSVDGQDIDELRLAGILGRRVPEHAVHAEEYLAVLRAEGATWCLEPREYAPRLAIGVHAYEQAYGTIWIVQGEQALSSLAPEILAEAATQAVPELARIALAGDAVRRLRNDRVTRLVHGIGPVDPIGLELGLPVGCDFRVIAFGASGQPVDELEMSAASDLVRNAFASYRVQAAVAMVAGRGIALVAGESHAPLVDV
ncbi:hypothetical protein OOT08_01990, partial [Leucobacter sp. M11]|nr:hypothetical protein [Leucobacter sp. M11]